MKQRRRVVWRTLVGIVLVLLLAACGLSGLVVARLNAYPHEPVVLELGTGGVAVMKRPALLGASGWNGGSATWIGRVGACRTAGSPLVLGDMQINMLRCRR